MARQQQSPSRRMFYLDPRSRTVSKCADRANERMAEIVQRVGGELAIKEIEHVVRLLRGISFSYEPCGKREGCMSLRGTQDWRWDVRSCLLLCVLCGKSLRSLR